MKPSIRAGERRRKLWRRRIEMVKRKKDRLEKGTEARRRARKSGLAPAGTRVIPDKRRKPEKHKPDLIQELD
jgi:hypothetical protein